MLPSGQLLEAISRAAATRAIEATKARLPISRGKRYSWRLIAIAPVFAELSDLVMSLFWFVHSSEMLSVLTARTLALRVAQEGPQGADWTASMRETLQTLVLQSSSMRRALHQGGHAEGKPAPSPSGDTQSPVGE